MTDSPYLRWHPWWDVSWHRDMSFVWVKVGPVVYERFLMWQGQNTPSKWETRWQLAFRGWNRPS